LEVKIFEQKKVELLLYVICFYSKKSVVRGESMLLKKQKQSDRNHSKQNPHTYLCKKKMRQTLTTHYTHTVTILFRSETALHTLIIIICGR